MMEATPETSTLSASLEPKPKKRWKRWFVWAVSLLLGVVGWFVFRALNQPAEGTIHTLAPKYDPSKPEAPPTLKQYTKQYFALTLSDTYEERARTAMLAEGTTLREQAYFTQPGGNLRKIAVTIDEQEGISPEKLTSYTYRKSHPELYREMKLSWHGIEVIAFEKLDSVYEVLAYLPQKNHLVASVALVSAYEPPEKLIGDFSETLALFEWAR